MDLLEVDLFANLKHEAFKNIADNVIIKKNRAKSIIVCEDQLEEPALYILKSGTIVITKTDLNGYELSLSIKKPGDTFGFLSIIDGEPRNGKAICLTDCECWVLGSTILKELFMYNSTFNLNLIKIYADFIRSSDRFHYSMVGKTAQKKTIFQLLKIGNVSDDVNITIINSYITHNIISSFAGISRETVSREINKLKAMGIITIKNKKTLCVQIDRAQHLLEA